MNELKTTAALVKHILETNPQARNSDSYLYYQVIKFEANQKSIDLRSLTVQEFLLCINQLGFTGFETVRRARQKIQAQYPELAANKSVSAARMENEKDFRAFARGDV